MATYNADIRVGITGKTQLNALERQLGRINKDLNQINKSLKAQTLTINTKGAFRALDQLDRKINKLNRTINVNANINERRRDKRRRHHSYWGWRSTVAHCCRSGVKDQKAKPD